MFWKHILHQCADQRAAFGGFGHGRHGFGHRGRGGGRGRSGERVFDHGDLKLVVMALLAEKPRHGYEIIKALEERVGGDYSPSPGVVYPTLTLLEELEYATVAVIEGGRKLYTLSESGVAFLAANRAQADAILARIDQVSAGRQAPAAQIIRAMENLHNALHLKMHDTALEEPQVRAIAAALDAAVNAIEAA